MNEFTILEGQRPPPRLGTTKMQTDEFPQTSPRTPHRKPTRPSPRRQDAVISSSISRLSHLLQVVGRAGGDLVLAVDDLLGDAAAERDRRELPLEVALRVQALSTRSSGGVKSVKPPAPLVRGMIVTLVTMS